MYVVLSIFRTGGGDVRSLIDLPFCVGNKKNVHFMNFMTIYIKVNEGKVKHKKQPLYWQYYSVIEGRQ